MTVLVNTFEGGSNGVTITTGNSGGVSGNAFDTLNIGSGATFAFDNAKAAHGSLSCKVATGASAAVSLAEWSASMGSQAQVWFRLYLYFTGNPAASLAVWRGYQGISTLCAGLDVASNGTLFMQNAAFGTIFSTTTAIPLNQWFRVEGFAIGSASVGQAELKLYSNADSTTATESHTSAANQNTTGAMDHYRYGVIASTANVGPWWMDDIGLSNTGYIGPVSTAGTSESSPVPIFAAAQGL